MIDVSWLAECHKRANLFIDEELVSFIGHPRDKSKYHSYIKMGVDVQYLVLNGQSDFGQYEDAVDTEQMFNSLLKSLTHTQGRFYTYCVRVIDNGLTYSEPQKVVELFSEGNGYLNFMENEFNFEEKLADDFSIFDSMWLAVSASPEVRSLAMYKVLNLYKSWNLIEAIERGDIECY